MDDEPNHEPDQLAEKKKSLTELLLMMEEYNPVVSIPSCIYLHVDPRCGYGILSPEGRISM
jgi:hypothetical protein